MLTPLGTVFVGSVVIITLVIMFINFVVRDSGPAKVDHGIYRCYDKQSNMVCFVMTFYDRSGIDCVPLGDTSLTVE